MTLARGIIYFFSVIVMVAAAYSDIRTGTIPVFLFPMTFVFDFLIVIVYQDSVLDSLIGLAIFTTAAMVCCIVSDFGGGDLLMLGAMGFTVGISGTLWFIGAAAASMTIWLIKSRQHPHLQVRLAPFVFSGVLASLIGRILHSAYQVM